MSRVPRQGSPKGIHIELPGDPGPCSFCGKPFDPSSLTQFGPDGEVLIVIEEKALELFVALERKRLQVEANALFERAARDLVRQRADADYRQQRQRYRYERELPSDAQFHAR